MLAYYVPPLVVEPCQQSVELCFLRENSVLWNMVQIRIHMNKHFAQQVEAIRQLCKEYSYLLNGAPFDIEVIDWESLTIQILRS